MLSVSIKATELSSIMKDYSSMASRKSTAGLSSKNLQMTKNDTGRLGEDAVCAYLTKRGYRICARNYRIKGGEIDVIAENSDYIAFVEVKTRRPDSLVTGFEAVDSRKRGRIIKTASDYCCKNRTSLQPRFDIASVIAENGAVISIDYITNAYDTTGYNFIF